MWQAVQNLPIASVCRLVERVLHSGRLRAWHRLRPSLPLTAVGSRGWRAPEAPSAPGPSGAPRPSGLGAVLSLAALVPESLWVPL